MNTWGQDCSNCKSPIRGTSRHEAMELFSSLNANLWQRGSNCLLPAPALKGFGCSLLGHTLETAPVNKRGKGAQRVREETASVSSS